MENQYQVEIINLNKINEQVKGFGELWSMSDIIDAKLHHLLVTIHWESLEEQVPRNRTQWENWVDEQQFILVASGGSGRFVGALLGSLDNQSCRINSVLTALSTQFSHMKSRHHTNISDKMTSVMLRAFHSYFNQLGIEPEEPGHDLLFAHGFRPTKHLQVMPLSQQELQECL